jgi:hypothetical protein
MTGRQSLRLHSAGIMLAAQVLATVASTLIMTDAFRFNSGFEIARDWLAIATLSSVLAALPFGDWLRTRSSLTCILAGLTGLLCLVVAIVLAWEAAAILENLQEPLSNGASIASNDFILDAINMKDPGDVVSSLEAIFILTFGFAGILTFFVPHLAAIAAGVVVWRHAGRNLHTETN